MTNEQAVAQAMDEIDRLKQLYMRVLRPCVDAINADDDQLTLDQFLECQKTGNSYFNFVENFVGNSGLLGAHANGKWVTGFAETCHSVLESFMCHVVFLRSHSDVLGGSFVEPNNHALANMQRMVKEYVSGSEWKNMKERMTKLDLPVVGFDSEAIPDMKNTPNWQLVVGLSVGVVFLLLMTFLAVIIPTPTVWQSIIFRGGFAISLAAIAAIIPGFINIESRAKKFSITAGGAIAIFVIVWFVNPPAMIGD